MGKAGIFVVYYQLFMIFYSFGTSFAFSGCH